MCAAETSPSPPAATATGLGISARISLAGPASIARALANVLAISGAIFTAVPLPAPEAGADGRFGAAAGGAVGADLAGVTEVFGVGIDGARSGKAAAGFAGALAGEENGEERGGALAVLDAVVDPEDAEAVRAGNFRAGAPRDGSV